MHHNHRTLALVQRPSNVQPPPKHLPVSKSRERQVAPASPPVILGPGRILNQTYALMGQYVENKSSVVAHRLGRGPLAAIERITDALGDGSTRQSRLEFLHRSSNGKHKHDRTDVDLRTLEMDCKRLLKHVQPESNSLSAQLEAFKGIIMLTTRYSSLGSIFFRSDIIQRARKLDEGISHMWLRKEEICGMTWEFYRRFAIFCVSYNDVMALVDKTSPQQLCSPCEGGLSIVERLLLYCSEHSELAKPTAIRCLGGILELPPFWSARNYVLQRLVVTKMCKSVIKMVEDFDVDCIDGDIDIITKRTTSDAEGLDILADAVLVGVQGWILRRFAAGDVIYEAWFGACMDLVGLFRNPSTESTFPKTWSRASMDWRAFIAPHLDDDAVPLSVPGVDKYEDAYVPLDLEEPNIELDHAQFPDIVSFELASPTSNSEMKANMDRPFRFLRPLITGWRRRLGFLPWRDANEEKHDGSGGSESAASTQGAGYELDANGSGSPGGFSGAGGGPFDEIETSSREIDTESLSLSPSDSYSAHLFI